ncbi:MAG TPA: UDP-3-O-(3-hydroxymyristoyl)glucosamine N-acyltransferase [Rhizomicrobium sp.]
MADPRFYDNCGPFALAEICSKTGVDLPESEDGRRAVADIAGLEDAGPRDLSYFVGKSSAHGFEQSGAGYCFVSRTGALPDSPRGMCVLSCGSAPHAFAAAANLFYRESELPRWSQADRIDASAKIETDVVLGPGVVVGPQAEIGRGTRIGPNTVIGRGVAIGRNCNIGSNVSIVCAYVGDGVLILSGAQIGQPGFGFASGANGHTKIPQLGRVIIQDAVEIGAATTIDRGALGDTVVGEGTKIDNLVQIGHNTRIGRHCIIVAQSGISGSCELGDFVVLGGQAGVADHARIGDGARLAARCAATPGDLPGGQDYGGVPARPMKQWARELVAVSNLVKRRKQDRDG